ncbi:MAG: hypothetical protein KY464_11375 [Gemmatimonadetes bacterium]|nr:hypothetical protein [Gemmatimonadota bacterium]
MTFRTTLFVLAVLCLSSPATPACAQWRDPRIRFAVDRGYPAAGSTGELSFRLRSLQAGSIDGSTAQRGRSALLGAGIGAGVGGAAFVIGSGGCWRKPESMCELAIPLYVGAGALSGGLLGFLLAAKRVGGVER